VCETESNESQPTEAPELNRPRRDVLKGIGAAVTAASLSPLSFAPSAAAAEGAAAASTEPPVALDPSKYPRFYQWTVIDKAGSREFPGARPGEPEIWCYTNQMSYPEGAAVDLRVHTNCETFSVRIDRESHVPEVVFSKHGIKGIQQRTPADAAIKGCEWKPALSVNTEGWKPGVYIVHVIAQDHKGNVAAGEHFFVVQSRNPGSHSSRCVILVTATYTAYNDWGGANHYRSVKDGVSVDILEPKLSLQRPWGRGLVVRPPEAPDVLEPTTPPPFWKPDYPDVIWALANNYSRHYVEGYSTYAARFIRWAEKNGYTLEFATQHDLHFKPELFGSYKSMIVLGHDEYWSARMRDTVDNFVDNGGHVARFAGNFVWQIRLEDNGDTQVCYKNAKDDPMTKSDSTQATVMWMDPMLKRPAAQTFGLKATGYSRYGAVNPRGSGGFTVYRPWHWAFAKTDLYYGDNFGNAPINIFGFEVDGVAYTFDKGLPYPTDADSPPEGLQILAMAPSAIGEPDRWNGTVLLNTPLMGPARNDREEEKPDIGSMIGMTPKEPGAESVGPIGAGMIAYFERGKGSVFNAGSPTWVRGLELGDYYTEQITKNVLDRYS